MSLLKETLNQIKGLDQEAQVTVKEKWDNLVKPLGSLGRLEEMTIQLAGITGQEKNKLDKKAVVVFAADNGVLEEGVSASPVEFTSLLTEAMAKNITGVATLAKSVGAEIVTVDVGLASDLKAENLIDRKISKGSKNFVKEAAMTYDQAIKSIEVGIEIADDLFNQGYDILGTGELGMGNTTTSSAVLTGLSDLAAEKTAGVGAGATKDQLQLKIDTINKGLDLHKPDKNDPIDVISKVGGFDIGAMCGVYLSGAKNRRPVVMDGFISSAAALCAVRLNPLVKDYIIPSHLSDEPGAKYMFQEIGLKPIFDLKMRLGEGSGCPLSFQLLETALYTLENMGSFEEATIDSTILIDMREEE